MDYPYQYQRPFQQQGIIRVSGMDGAKAFQMGPNQMVALFDANDDVFYFKTTDGGGFPTIRAFRFEEIFPVSKQDAQYVTRQEIEDMLTRMTSELSARIDNIAEVTNGKQPVQQHIPSV